MKTLPPIRPTPEQLPLISQNRLGVEVIRGAAGSGKTSTAILRLRSLSYMFEERRLRNGDPSAVKILVLTFNRTLRGYVEALARDQIENIADIELIIDTFGHWSTDTLDYPDIVAEDAREQFIIARARHLPLAPKYVVGEVDYLLGRFAPEDLNQYITAERTGRGLSPRVDREVRESILRDVVAPYKEWLAQRQELDWNDLAVRMGRVRRPQAFDIAIVDEAQDFSANQLRAIRHHLAPESATTFVIDTVQRIYARGFTWQETGFDIRPNRYHTLKANHRNTIEIARFAAGVLRDLRPDDDGSLPDLDAASRTGPIPTLLEGKYSDQLSWAISKIKRDVNLKDENVAFLAPLGGGYLTYLKGKLTSAGIRHIDLTRRTDWPGDDVNVAISTFHSAKGLEFDHVFILGLSRQNTTHGDETEDDQIHVLRRLFAVGIARARDTVAVGYKPGEESDLIGYIQPGTYQKVTL